MAENGIDENKSNVTDSPYEFKFGDGTEKSVGGTDKSISGTFTEVQFVDPASGNTTSGTGNDTIGDTGSSSGTGTEINSGRRRRSDAGRIRGPRTTKASVQAGLGGFDDAIFAIHLFLAGICRSPELELDQEEAKKVTEALDRLSSHYNVAPSETTRVWMNFVGAMGSVYGPRVVSIYTRAKAPKKKSEVSNVEPLFPNMGLGTTKPFPNDV